MRASQKEGILDATHRRAYSVAKSAADYQAAQFFCFFFFFSTNARQTCSPAAVMIMHHHMLVYTQVYAILVMAMKGKTGRLKQKSLMTALRNYVVYCQSYGRCLLGLWFEAFSTSPRKFSAPGRRRILYFLGTLCVCRGQQCIPARRH